MVEIAPGSTIRVEITAAPKTVAAGKTLARLFAKDPVVARQKRWRKHHRPSLQTWRRGGRPWEHRMRSRLPIELKPGATCTIRATTDVIRDLASVARWVKLSPA